MSSFKKLNKADITTVPYAANKQWILPSSCPSVSNSYFNIYNGTFITGTFSLNNYAADPITNGQYERLVYNSINHLFYQAYSGSLLDTSSLMFNLNTYQSASQQRPTGAYFDYNINPNLVKNFPTGAGASIKVLAVNQEIYGSKILPSSFRLSSSVYDMKDDGNGNIYSGSIHIGNVFYAHGLAVITNPDYQGMFPSPPVAVDNIATFLTSNTSVKTINILQNDISRSCALDTGSVVLSGSNSQYYTVNANGTITLDATGPGNYDVYYTVNSICGNGCSLTSNKAKVEVNVIAVNPPPCITVEFYGGKPDQTFYYVECGSSTTSSLTLNDTDAPIQKCIDGGFGVSGSTNYSYIGNCAPVSTPSGCSLYLLCAADRAPFAEFYYVTCSGASVTESLGTSGDCYFDANYRCITGSITLANPYGSYQLISLNCPPTPVAPTSSALLNVYVSAQSGSGTITGSEVWYALSSSFNGTQPSPPGMTWIQLSSSFTAPICNNSPLLVGSINVPYTYTAYVQVSDAGRSNLYYIGYNSVDPCTNGTASNLYTNTFSNNTSGSNITSSMYNMIVYPVTTSVP
jgi:hypothetical protein